MTSSSSDKNSPFSLASWSLPEGGPCLSVPLSNDRFFLGCLCWPFLIPNRGFIDLSGRGGEKKNQRESYWTSPFAMAIILYSFPHGLSKHLHEFRGMNQGPRFRLVTNPELSFAHLSGCDH